jgi:hypothetical protein
VRISNFVAASASVLWIVVGCTSTQPSNHLSRREAIEIADEEVFRVTKSDLRQFGPPEASHVEDSKSWSVSYRRRHHTEAELTVEVDEQKGTAVVQAP